MSATPKSNKSKKRSTRPSASEQKMDNTSVQVKPALGNELRDKLKTKYQPDGKLNIAQIQLAWGDLKKEKKIRHKEPPNEQTLRNFLKEELKSRKYWLIDGLCQLLLNCSLEEWEEQHQQTPLEEAYLKQQNQTKAEASSQVIANQPWSSSFQTIIDDKTKDFVGREYVFDAIALPDWHKICREMLNSQKQHLRQQITQIGSELDVHVPLGLVERRHLPRRDRDFSLSPEQGSDFFQLTEDEIIKTYEHNEFLELVIQQGQSKKSQGKRIVIIGEPGAGKTTTLQQIAFSKDTPGFPIWISLKSLGEKRLEKYLSENWLKGALKTSDITQHQKALEELFKSGKVLLLLDGVDEMPASSPVNALAKIREELTGWVDSARVVLTCRVNIWEASVNSLQGFDTYRTLDFSYGDSDKPDQVKQFICEWFIKAEKPELGELLREKLDEDRHQRIRDLVKNPLRLSLLCQSWYFRQGYLPKTKAALYEQFARAFYEWRDKPSHTTVTERKKLNTTFGILAREAIDQEKSRFAIRESFAVDEMGEDLFNLATEKLNWLVHVYNDADTGEKVYAFFHPTFQEYFAACGIVNWDYFLRHIPHNPNQGIYRIFEPQWKEVILLWLGREIDKEFRRQKEEFITALVGFEDGCKEQLFGYKGFYEYRAYFLAAAGIAEFKDSKFSDEIVRQLIKWGIGTDFKESSLPDEIVKQLVQDGGRQSHAPYRIRKKAEAALQETDRLRVINALIELIRTSSVKDIRHKAIEILGEVAIDHLELKQVFINLLNNSPDDYSRIKVAKSLGKVDPSNQQLLATLVDFVHNSTDNYIICEARSILGEIAPNHPEGAKIAEPTLLLESVKAGHIDPNNPQLHQLIINEARCSTDGWRRGYIIRDLGYIVPSGHSEAIKVLIEVIQTSTDEMVLFEAVRSLARIGKSDPEAIGLLIELIYNSKDISIRHQAVRGLRHTQTSYEEVIRYN